MTDTRPTPLSLQQLQRRIAASVINPTTTNVWVMAELSDVNMRGGHCYMELIQKDERGLNPLARARAMIWSSNARYVLTKFSQATGRQLTNSIKVMLLVSASYHDVFGLSLVVHDIDPSYTLGDQLRNRRMIVERLKAEGILDQNKQLEWPDPVQRVAVISAPTGAGFGDFVKHLFLNPSHLRFAARLYPAVMQGEKAPRSVIEALGRVIEDDAEGTTWDCVVVIRGGGATSDLTCFDNYDVAAAIAMCPIPVIVGIGHDRDETVLDYVGNIVVKTPTAAADVLINRGEEALGRLVDIAHRLAAAPMDRIAGLRNQLAQLHTAVTLLPQQIVERSKSRLANLSTALMAQANRFAPLNVRLDALQTALEQALATTYRREATRLDNLDNLLKALGPEATLRRGFSITRVGGKTVTDIGCLSEGAEVTTMVADGQFTSTVNKITRQ